VTLKSKESYQKFSWQKKWSGHDRPDGRLPVVVTQSSSDYSAVYHAAKSDASRKIPAYFDALCVSSLLELKEANLLQLKRFAFVTVK